MKNMEDEEPYTRRENRYFQNNSDIKHCFPSYLMLLYQKTLR